MFLPLLSFYSYLYLLLSSGSSPNWSKVAFQFFQFTNYSIHVEVTRKKVNHGVGLGPKIPVKYFFMEMQES